jgi:endo-1,4-beta-mannosidase
LINSASKDQGQTFVEHLVKIRAYAIKTLLQGEVLTDEELADKSARMNELMTMSRSFSLTQKTMTKFIFKGLFYKQIS